MMPDPNPQPQRSEKLVRLIRQELDAKEAAKQAHMAIDEILRAAKLAIQELQRRAEKARELDAR